MLLKLIAAIGAENAFLAERLIMVDFSYEAASTLIVQWVCAGCRFKADLCDPEQIRGIDPHEPKCPDCQKALVEGPINPFTLRQRIHRMQRKVRDLLPGFEVQKRRRAVVRYGAEESGVFRTAAAASAVPADEGAEE